MEPVMLVDVLEEHQEALLALPNVVGVAIGIKSRGGELTSEPAIVILVEKKLPPASLADEEMVPPLVSGVVTDVIEVGAISAMETGTP